MKHGDLEQEITVIEQEDGSLLLESPGAQRLRAQRLRAAGTAISPTQRQVWLNGQTITYERLPLHAPPPESVSADHTLVTTIPSVVTELLVKVGQTVTANEKLILLESMKMVIPILAPYDGLVRHIHCAPGDAVQPGVPLIEVEGAPPLPDQPLTINRSPFTIFPTPMNLSRLSRLQDEILENGLDGIALVPGPNMVYISGIHSHLSERPIVLFVPDDDDPAIIIPGLEAMKAEAAGIRPDRIFAWSDEDGYTGAFQQACAHLELSDYLLGVEALHMRVLEFELLKRYAPGLSTTHAEPTLSALRLSKDEDELDAIERAIEVAETAMKRLIPRIQIGQTEKEIAAMLNQELIDAGADGISFSPIVSAGPNGASPHAVPTNRPIQSGDLLIIDWGAMVDDYPSDITRTFAVGPISPEMRRIYEVVKAANAIGRQACGPGASGQEVDEAARGVIDDSGYGEYFIHRTGHGLGLEIHEPPYMMQGNTEGLIAGTVFTVEPGIYLPGVGGVRIEDNIVITAEGSRTMTTFPRDLITVG